jgi:hypothetical protein
MSKEIPAAMAKPVRKVSVIRQMNADPRDILKVGMSVKQTAT